VIEEIRIRSLGVIEESSLELGPGFTAITGETGAGKTMVVTALGLLLGGRADSGAVRTGDKAARVEGVVRLGGWADDLRDRLDELGADFDEDTLVVARHVAAEGRSRAFVGGSAVPVAALGEISERLVAVHGQSDQHRLRLPAAQRESLDRFAGAGVLTSRERFAGAYRRLRDVERELADVLAAGRERAREADLLGHGLREIEAVAPQLGEDVALAEEEVRLAFADTLRAAAEAARNSLSSDEDGPDALGTISTARRQLEGVRVHDPEAAALADRTVEISYALSDLAADVASYVSALETDPVRLAQVSERRAALKQLTRKYGEDVEAVLAWAADAAERLDRFEHADEHVASLRAEAEILRMDLSRVGADLSAARVEAARRLGEAVTAELGALSLADARVVIEVCQVDDADGVPLAGRPVRIHPHGLDEVEILFSANVGSEPRALGKGASGGELSRLMLALEVVLAASNPVPTFVFDEIDAGIGGRAAVEVGRRLARLAETSQVVVVTHLPQVAAFADRHVMVVKSSDGRITTSGLSVLTDTERVGELSRMLAGLEDSATARAHAEELLQTARSGGDPR
jgi:DNA repair protein RecN (Recombination protein N)